MATDKNNEADTPGASFSQDKPTKAADPGKTHEESRGNGKLDEKKLKKHFIGSIDAGTTSSRFIIFDGTGNPVAQHQIEFTQQYPQSGYANYLNFFNGQTALTIRRWHEQDPQELIDSVRTCIDKATENFINLGHKASDVSCVGITNQRESTLVWDSKTGKPLYNCVAWPDTRTRPLVQELKARKGADELQDICGLPLSTYPSSVKLLWLLKNNDAVSKAYEEGRLTFGTVDTWLLWHLNGGIDKDILVTDATNASRTMFMNLHTLKYDEKLLSFFGLDQNKIRLPKIVPSSDPKEYGSISSGALKNVPITGCLGDQSAALVGQQGFSPGSAKNTVSARSLLVSE
jgi:glycerol kinase